MAEPVLDTAETLIQCQIKSDRWTKTLMFWHLRLAIKRGTVSSHQRSVVSQLIVSVFGLTRTWQNEYTDSDRFPKQAVKRGGGGALTCRKSPICSISSLRCSIFLLMVKLGSVELYSWRLPLLNAILVRGTIFWFPDLQRKPKAFAVLIQISTVPRKPVSFQVIQHAISVWTLSVLNVRTLCN